MQTLSLELQSFPDSVETFKNLRDDLAQTPFGGAALFAVALNVFSEDPVAGIPLLTIAIDVDLLVDGKDGVAGKQPAALRDFKDRNGQKPWIARSIFQGTCPADGYRLPAFPLSILFGEQRGDILETTARVFILTTGADSPKPIRLKKNDKGFWKACEWSSFQGNCRAPETKQIDDL